MTALARSYDRNQGRFDRDSWGRELVAGTAADLGGVFLGEVFAGHLQRSYDDPGLPRISGPAFGGLLQWNATPLTTLNARLARGIEESVLQASGFLSTRTEVGVDHELLRNLVLSANVSLTRNDYEATRGGPEREDDVLGLDFGGLWLLNRDLHVELGYRIGRRSSENPGEDYDSRALTVNLRFQI